VSIYVLAIIIVAAGLVGRYWRVMRGFRNGDRVHRLRVGAVGFPAEGGDDALSPCLLP
jgi:hypothetical protein